MTRRIAAAVSGWTFMGLGIAVLLAAGRGVAPMDALCSGFAYTVDLPVGTASWIVTVFWVAIALLLGAKLRPGTIFTAFTIGLVINLALPSLPTPTTHVVAFVQGVLGLSVLLLGTMLTISSDFGPGAVDLTMLAVHNKGLSLRVSRWIVEGSMLAMAIFLGGQIGWMTLFIVTVSAPIIAYFLPKVRQLVTPDIAVLP